MEWNRDTSAQPVAQPANQSGPAHGVARKSRKSLMNMRTAAVALLVSASILVLGVIGFVATRNPESLNQYVDKSKMQAVFLNGGQVYFGKITGLDDKTVRVSDIYYLRVNQQVQPDGSTSSANQAVSLVKLGCELHGPQDNMVINQSQVIFWENLKDDGQVAKAVVEYKKTNPGGQKCDAPASSSTPTSTTPTTTTPTSTTKKP